MKFFIHIFLFLVACCVEKYILPDISYNDVKNAYTKSLIYIRTSNLPLPDFLFDKLDATKTQPTEYTIASVDSYSDLPTNN